MKLKGPWARVTVAVATVAALSVPALQASAAVSGPAKPAAVALPAVSGSTAAPDVSSTPLSTWQVNGTVWSLAYGSGVVYAGGNFTDALPPGTAVGGTTGEVASTFIAAFNSTTGALITGFAPTITGGSGAEVTAMSVIGNTLYIGGNFNHINGVYRDNLAAFNISNPSAPTLLPWAPTAFGTVLSMNPSPSGASMYLGGDFNELDGVARTYAGEVSTTGTGTTAMAWDPVLNNSVTSVAASPDNNQVLLGGYFTSFNGVSQNSIGATDTATGTASYNIPAILPNDGSCVSNVKDIIISPATGSNPGGTAYIAAEGTGGGCFDGDYSVNLSGSGASVNDTLNWQNDCLGATQSLVIINGYLFKGSHAHDCAYAPGGFPQVSTAGGGWVSHHLLDQSLTDGTIQHFNPDTSSPNGGLGPRVMATDGSQLFLGGDFTLINGTVQQGFAIFPAGPDPQYPTRPSVAPSVTSTTAGTVNIQFPAVSERDVGTLTYSIYQDSGTKPIATLTANSWPWALPTLSYNETGLTPGSVHTYTYTAADGGLVTAKSPASASVTVASTSPTASYQQAALADSPSFFWPLNDTGGTAADATGNGFTGIYEPGTTQGVTGPFPGSTATGFDGFQGNVDSSQQIPSPGPQTFSIEMWFKTTTDMGGKLIGFSNAQTGGNSGNNNSNETSSNYDRHIYMMNDGQLVFGVWTGSAQTIETPGVYNDGQWHYVVATIGPSGMTMYVDGQLVGTNSNTAVQNYAGYWRVGGDNLNGWNLDPWGSNSQGTTEPASYWFNGDIADVAVYPTALSAAQVGTHYAAGLNQQLGG